jgi:phage head maturation protease
MKYISAARFKQIAMEHRGKKDFGASDFVVRKLFTTSPEMVEPPEGADNAEGLTRFTITTPSLDREGDTIALEGWQLDAYHRNPVVLWGHDTREPPIGRSMGITRVGDTLKSDVKWVPADVPIYGPRAEGIRQLCARGFLFACSVGFRPIEFEISEDETRGNDWFPGINFISQEMLEFSVVSVPAHPDALIEPEPPLVATDETDESATAAASAAIRRSMRRHRLRTARLHELT